MSMVGGISPEAPFGGFAPLASYLDGPWAFADGDQPCPELRFQRNITGRSSSGAVGQPQQQSAGGCPAVVTSSGNRKVVEPSSNRTRDILRPRLSSSFTISAFP